MGARKRTPPAAPGRKAARKTAGPRPEPAGGEARSWAEIWAVVRRIPPGKVATYGQVAALAGRPGHARQAGYAMHALPDGSDVPWQRVINAQGEISPRAEGGWAEGWQRHLLEEEGVAFDRRGRVDLARFRWDPDERPRSGPSRRGRSAAPPGPESPRRVQSAGRRTMAKQPVTIWHNPRCSTSRRTLELLREQGFEPEVVEYLKQPPTAAELGRVLRRLGKEPREVMRTRESVYAERGLADPGLSREELIAAMVADPILIERPIVLAGARAALGRPPEAVLAIL